MTDMHPHHHHTSCYNRGPSFPPHGYVPPPQRGGGGREYYGSGHAVMEVEVITEVALLLHPHHIIILRGGTEQLMTVFC